MESQATIQFFVLGLVEIRFPSSREISQGCPEGDAKLVARSAKERGQEIS